MRHDFNTLLRKAVEWEQSYKGPPAFSLYDFHCGHEVQDGNVYADNFQVWMQNYIQHDSIGGTQKRN